MFPINASPLPASLSNVKKRGESLKPVQAYDTTDTGETVETKYDTGIDYVENRDYRDIRAMRQGNLEAAGNILGRNLGKLATRTLDGLTFAATAPGFLLKGLATGEVDSLGSAAEAAIDNPVSKSLRDAEKWLDEQMPIYQTKAQDSSIDLTSAGFADKLLNGVAYVGSMSLGTNGISAAASKMLQMAKGSKNLGRIFAGAMEEGKDLNYVTNLFSDATALSAELSNIGTAKKVTNALRDNFADFYGGAIESAAEASGTREEVLNNLRTEALEKNGGQPLTQDQEDTIKEQANKGLLANFGVNLLTTGVANKLVFHKLLNNKWSDDMVAYNQVAKSGDKYILQEAAAKTGKYQKLFTPIEKLAKGAIVKGAATEAAQELGQFASNDFLVNLYSQPDADSVYKVDNVLKSLLDTGKNLGSKDAIESALLGGIIGAGFGGVLNRNDDKNKKANTERLVGNANMTSTSNSIKALAQNIKYSDSADGALINGDRVTYETLKAAQIFDWVNSRDAIGKYGDVKTELEEAKSLPLAKFVEAYDIKDKNFTEDKRAKFIDYISDIADKTKEAKTRLMSNYGHKLTQLEAENPDITQFLTMIDVLGKDYANRETALLTKIAPYINRNQLIANQLTPEKQQEFKQQIVDLQERAKTIGQEAASIPDELIQRNDKLKTVMNQIATLQNTIANTANEANYLELTKITGLDEEKTEKKTTERTKYSEYTKDLNDLKQIQTAKESLIDYYSKIVNDVDYAKKVQGQINIANQSSLVEHIFALNLDTEETPRLDSAGQPIVSNGQNETDVKFVQPPTGTQGPINDYIKTGDIYQLYRKQTKAKTWEALDTLAPYEVIDTSIDVVNGVPVGKVTVQGQRGEKLTVTANQFKTMIRPFKGYNGQVKYKYDQESENMRFFRMFKDRAIKYDKNGEEIIGMLGFSAGTNNPEDLVLKYKDSTSKYKTTLFKTGQFGKGYQNGYIKILSERETLAYQLNTNAEGYMNVLLKEIQSKAKSISTSNKKLVELQQRLKTATLNANVNEQDAINRAITSYSKFVTKLETQREVKQAAADRLSQLQGVELSQLDDLGSDLNKIIDKVIEYGKAEAVFKPIKKEQLVKAYEIEIDGDTKTIDALNEELDKLKQSFVDSVIAKVNPEDAATITDASLNSNLDLQYIEALKYAEEATAGTPLNDVLINAQTIADNQAKVDAAGETINERVQAINEDYTEKLLDATKLSFEDLQSLKAAELETIARFMKFINQRGFFVSNRKIERKVEETNYDLEGNEFVTSRPSFILKTTGNSEQVDNLHKKEFYRKIHKLSPEQHKTRVIRQDEYRNFDLEGQPNDAIFLAVTDLAGNDISEGGKKLVTTLPLNTLTDTFGNRFRDFEQDGVLSPIRKEIGDSLMSSVNPDNFYESISNKADQLKRDYPKETSFIDDVTNQLTDLQNLRDTILANRDKNIIIDIAGKSNGVPRISTDPSNLSDQALTNEGKIVIPDSGDTYVSGDVSYRVTSGRAYFEDPTTRSFFPIVTERIGNKQIVDNKGRKWGSFVENIVNGGRFLQASLEDKAKDSYGNVVSPETALTDVNNMLSYITYTNRNIDKPDSMFEFQIEDSGVVFYIGSSTPLRLVEDEELIKQLLAQKIFNIDRKSLNRDNIHYNLYQPIEGGFQNKYFINSNYQQFVRDNFGVKTNIVPNKDGSLYKNGYLILDKSPSISDIVAEAPIEVKEGSPEGAGSIKLASKGTSKLAGLKKNKKTAVTPDPNVKAEEEVKEAPPAGKIGSALARLKAKNAAVGTTPTPTKAGLSKLDDDEGEVKGRRRLLTTATYKGDTSLKMSPKQLEAARKKFYNKYNVPFDLVKGLIDNNAFGAVLGSAEVLISEQAPIGTDYHEEFHLVSQHILSNGQLQDLYTEWRAKNDEFASDDLVEEELAEGYRLQAQGYQGFTGKIKAIFDYLTNTIKKLLGIRNINTLYNDIYRGKYYGASTYKGTKTFKASGENPLPYEVRQKAFSGATRQLVIDLVDSFAANVVTDAEEITDANRKEAIGILSTDKDARLDYLNYVDEDGKSFLRQMVKRSLKSYLNEVDDTTSAQVLSYLDSEVADVEGLLSEYNDYIAKALNLKGLEESDIDEDTTGKDIVKKGDNEIDFYNDSVTQLRFLIYTQPDASGNYPINPATVVKIYIDNLADSKNSQEFEDKLRVLDSNKTVIDNYDAIYRTAIKGINELVGVNSSNRTKAEQFMIGNLWSSFSKMSTDFKILKVTDPEQGFGIDYHWVEASKEASLSATKGDLTKTIKDNYTKAKNLIQSTKTNSKGQVIVNNADQVFEALFEIPVNKFRTYNPNRVQPLINAFARTANIDAYLKGNSGINDIIEYQSQNNVEKVFSFFNAGNKLQHGLQNPSSLFYRLRDLEPRASIMTMHKPVAINGIQKKLARDTNNRTSNDITEEDLHILYFNSFIRKNKAGSKTLMPFIFSGDKSTLTGIEITQGELMTFGNSLKQVEVNGKVDYEIDHTTIYRQYFEEELQDLQKIIKLNKEPIRVGSAKAPTKEDLPFFSFLDITNPALYKRIVDDVKAATNESGNRINDIFARHIQEVEQETKIYFRNRGIELAAQYNKIGFDYKDVLVKNDGELTKGKEQAYLNWFASAYAIGVQEQTRLVGSLNFYDQAAKRLPAWNGTKRALRTDKKWTDWYNNTYKSDINVADLRALTIPDVGIQQDILDEGIYSDNTPSDAQAYISLDAARFMLFSSGTYSYRLDDLFREIEAIEKKANVSEQDMQGLNTYVQELNEYMNVLKPQYYGLQEVGGLEVPTFYKFSVLPLTKVLTQGRNLDTIRELMATEGGPHIVMFDSANKVGRRYKPGLDLYDKEGNYIFDQLSVQDKLDAMQHSSWEGLGIQVDMPKAHETVTFGTQMRKLITVDLDGTYTINGQTLSAEEIRKYNDDLIIEKLESDKADLMSKLGLDESLTVTPENVNKVKKELIRQASVRDVSNSFIESIKQMDSFDFITNKSKLQQFVNSMVSKAVIKQTMTGDAKAMVSSVGFEKKGGGIQGSNRLKFYKKGSQSYMEVLLPANMMQQYQDHVYYDEKSNSYLFKPSASLDIQKLIGYRIPTQAPASIENIIIKGFLPAVYGNAVVVPFELTSKAGSDFDIDKLNLFLPKFKFSISNNELTKLLDKLPANYFFEGESRLDNYKEMQNKLAEDLEPSDTVVLKYIKENAKGKYTYDTNNIDNRIIKFYTDLMSSPEYFDNFVNSIDENDFKDLAKEIGNKRGLAKTDKDEKTSSNFYNPLYIAKRRSSFMNAKDTLGAAAISTTHHAESQKHKVAFNSTNLNNGKYARVVAPEANATLGELLSLFQSNVEENGKIRLDRIFNFEGKKISGILSQIVNASVDAAKDDYITSANLDLETVGVATLMIRAGIPLAKVVNFISQPGIVEYTNALRKTKITALPATNKSAARELFNDGDYSKVSLTDINNLSNNISPEGVTLNNKQADLIDLYRNLEKYAQVLTDLQQISTFDTKATGSMLEENEINLFKYDTFVANSARMFSGLDSMLNDKTSFTARMREEARNANNFNNSLFKLGDLYTAKDSKGQVMLDKVKSQLRALFETKSKAGDKSYTAFKFKNYFNSYLLQRIALSNDASFPSVVARTIPQVKNFTGDNTFIKRLRTGDGKLFMHGGASINSDEANALTASFTDLYKNPNTKDLARDIMMSGLYQFGLVNNPSTIMNVIPTTLLLQELKITGNHPIIEVYNKVKKLDNSLNKATDNAWEHAKAAKGENHFSNYVIAKPVANSYNNLGQEDPNNC